MADTKISALTAVTTLTGASELAVNEAGTSKKATASQLINNVDIVGQMRTIRLTADHSIAATAATEVTGLSTTLVAGTYLFEYYLVCQSTSTTTGLGLGINYTGTVTRLSFTRRMVTTATTTTTGVAEDVVNNATGAMVEGWAGTAETTTTPNTVNAGVAAANTDHLEVIEGIVTVSDGGDLELWHSSELANTTTVESDSCLRVTRLV